MSDEESDRRAFRRFLVLGMVRFVGLGLVLVGIAVLQRLLDWPPVLAYLLTAAGFLTFFLLPRTLAKGWRSNDPDDGVEQE